MQQKRMYVIGSLAERLAARTLPGINGCTRWTGQKTQFGYGLINPGKTRKTRGSVRTSQAAWFVAYGVWPQDLGLCVCHKCDNPECHSLDHLFLGTKADNSADMVRKGRSGNQVLTDLDVREMRFLHAHGVSKAALARNFSCSPATAGRVIERKSRVHI